LETNYPWDGNVKVNGAAERKSKFALHIRVRDGHRASSTRRLYVFEDKNNRSPSSLNGKPVDYKMEKGYALIDRDGKRRSGGVEYSDGREAGDCSPGIKAR